MTYSIIIFIFTLFSFFLNEVILLPFLLLFSSYGQLKLKLNAANLLYFFGVIFSIIISFAYNILDFNLHLGIHLLLIFLLTIFIKDKQFDIYHIINLVKLFMLLNLLLIVLDVIQFDFSLTFTQHDIPRFKSVFLEPSVASFIFILSLIILFNYSEKSTIWIFINLVFILITFSGSGYVILIVLILFSLKIKLTKKSLIRILIIALISLPTLFVFMKSEGFEKLVSKRFERIESGGDNSSKLRFLAPLQAAEYTIKNSPIWGFGLGSAEKVIDHNRANFSYFKHFDDTPTTKINNAYAVIFMSGGILLLTLHFLFICSLYKYVNRKTIHLYVFFIIYPFFSGHYANILMWFIVYLIIHLGSCSMKKLKVA